MPVGSSRPSDTALCCLGLLRLIQLCTLFLLLLPVFWGLPGEEDWGEFCSWVLALPLHIPLLPRSPKSEAFALLTSPVLGVAAFATG